MPQRNSINSDKATTLRRSARLLQQNTATIQKNKSRKNQVSPCPISSSVKTHLNSPISSIKNVSLKKTHEGFPEKITDKSVRLTDGSKNSAKSTKGSRGSKRKIDGVEGFRTIRRSPRVPNLEKPPESIGKKTGSDGVNGESTRFVRHIFDDFSDKEFSSKVTQNGNLERRRTRSLGAMGLAKVAEKAEVGTNSPGEFSRETKGGWTRVGSVISPAITLKEEGEIKRTNFNRGTEDIGDKRNNNQREKDCSPQEVNGRLDRNHLLSPLSSIENLSPKKTAVEYPEEVKKKLVRSIGGLKKSMKSINESRKSTGKIKGSEVFQGLRQMTNFSDLENTPEFVNKKTSGNKPNLVKEESTQLMCGISTEFSDNEVFSEVTEKGDSGERQTKSIGGTSFAKVVGEVEVGVNPSEELEMKMDRGRRMASSVVCPAMIPKEVGEKERRNVNSRIGDIGDKRKSNHYEENGGLQEWTKDQEVALQRAYFSAKPSPHFWKKVSKLVPGKSAQECFDKVHSDLVTPPQPRPRSRVNRTNFSPLGHFSLSGSKLLAPTELNVKRPRSKKQKNHLAQKTVRHLLQKHYLVDQGYEADLFSVLEPASNSSTRDFPETKILSTPECVLKTCGFLQECHERSSSTHKKPLSRFRDTCETALVSPPVLKQVKNMALHEKYIDQLHCREARRTVGATKCITTKEDRKKSHVPKMDAVKTARNALVSDARSMINQYQHLQVNITSNYKGFNDDDDGDGEEDEGKDGP